MSLFLLLSTTTYILLLYHVSFFSTSDSFLGSSLASSLVSFNPMGKCTTPKSPTLTSGLLFTKYCHLKPTAFRGSIGTVISNMFTLGCLYTYVSSYFIASWRTVAWLQLVPCALLGLATFFAPNSPYWLQRCKKLQILQIYLCYFFQLVLIFGPLWVIFGPFWQFWVIFGLFCVILGHVWAIFWC